MISVRNFLRENYTGWRFDGEEPTNEAEFAERILFDPPVGPTWTEFSNELTAARLTELRTIRNEKLSETDWWVLPDRTPSDEQLAYRQALRDITDNYTSLEDVVWPEKPE